MPDDSLAPGNAEDMAINGSVLALMPVGGGEGIRTPGLLDATEAL